MHSNNPLAEKLFSIVAVILLPVASAAQDVVDLPGQDQALTVVQEDVFSVGSAAGEDWESFARVRQVAFDAEGNLDLSR